MGPSKMNPALLYVRVSSKEQEKEGYSLDAQEKLGHEYALRKGLSIVKTWKVSESAWNNKKERVAFNQMIDYAKTHSDIEHIIFDITDRMTRNDFDKLKIIELIQYGQKTIHFSRSNKIYNKDSSPDDLFMLDIEVAVAKKMSNDISRKTKMGMQEKAEQGIYPSISPLGYKNTTATRQHEINHDQAPFIKKAFDLMASGHYSLQMVSEILQKEGFRTNRSSVVNKSTLSYLLGNPFYYGIFIWKGQTYQGNHEPLISKDLFDRTQAVLNGKFHPSKNKKVFPFNNLAVCGTCGCKILGERKKKLYNYYHCTFSKGRHNGIGYIREERLAEMFKEPVKRITINEDLAAWLKEGLAQGRKNTLQTQENRLSSLKTQQGKVSSRLSRLFDLRLDKEIDEEAFKAKENELKTQAVEIKTQIDAAGAMNPNFYEDGVKTLELCKLLYSEYHAANYEGKAQILKRIASNFTLSDATLYPIYRKPFSFFAEGLSRSNWLPLLDDFRNWLFLLPNQSSTLTCSK